MSIVIHFEFSSPVREMSILKLIRYFFPLFAVANVIKFSRINSQREQFNYAIPSTMSVK